jgi:hypothetical protein
MRLRGGGVGHLSTRHCNNMLLQDQHTLLHDNVDVLPPGNVDEEAIVSDDSDEGNSEADEEAINILDGDLGDEDIIAAAGFSVL